MRQLNRWLHQHPEPRLAPLRERSLQVFGDDKLLETIFGRTLGRRLPACLAVYAVPAPIVIEEIAPRRDSGVLLVENPPPFIRS